MDELGRKKLGQTHAVGKECKAIVLLSADLNRDSPRQLWVFAEETMISACTVPLPVS